MMSSVVRHGGDAVAAKVGDEVVVLNSKRGVCYCLNKTASHIWNLASEPMPVSEICARLTIAFDIEAARCEDEVLSVLTRLQAEELIQSVAAPLAPQPE